jgi:hypothetical protein
VVSREVISRKTGTLTVFAFDRGQGSSETVAFLDATVFCVDNPPYPAIKGQHKVSVLVAENASDLIEFLTPLCPLWKSGGNKEGVFGKES